jgi:general stress protein 26
MHTPQELEAKFWKALSSDMTMMLGLEGVDDGHTRPMTAQVEDGNPAVWFFTSQDNAMVRALAAGHGGRSIGAFVAKGHDLFASVHGTLCQDNDRAVVDRLWNRFVAAWYEGKDDPKLALLRFDAERAEIWLNESSMLAGAKLLLGGDPKKSYKDHVAKVQLHPPG